MGLLLILAALRTFSIDGGASSAQAHVGKTGLGSFAGHEHLVLAQNIQGEVALDPEDLPKSSVDLIVDARSLEVSPEGEPNDDAPKVQQVMRGPEVLDTARFGTIHFGSTSVSGRQVSAGVFDLVVTGELSLHGVVKPLTLPVHVEVRGSSLVASGKFTVKQTDFGIEPTSAAGGLVKVADEVGLSFRLAARAP
ncbi:MAG: YceI family protein [Myxococcales bacterium]|nr:YceI family protein [Myxococcales bacterium]